MRKIISMILLGGALTLLIGCKDTSQVKDYSLEQGESSSENMDEYEDDSEYDQELSGYAYASQSKMEGNVIIRPTCMLLLKDDGTVVGKGDSDYGELGNGKRTGCSEWTPVSDLTEVKKIYANHNVGADLDCPEYGSCFALTENGDLYRWGRNLLKPECILQEVEDICQIGNKSSYYLIENNNGKKVILLSSYASESIMDVTDIVRDSEVLSAGEEHIIIKDIDSSMSYLIVFDFGEGKENDGILFYNKCKEVGRYKLCDDIERVVYDDYTEAYFLSKEGAVRSYKKKEHSISFKDWGGKGYINYYRIYYAGDLMNKVALWGSKVTTIGENRFGQLGDGTDLDYWDDWISIDDFVCSELYVGQNREASYCVALDDSNNIWCWGGGFGSTPKIILGQGGIDEDIGDY